eukprot:SAG31_NODE_1861_length_7044_cov_169.866379_2_plen_78_part_00
MLWLSCSPATHEHARMLQPLGASCIGADRAIGRRPLPAGPCAMACMGPPPGFFKILYFFFLKKRVEYLVFHYPDSDH